MRTPSIAKWVQGKGSTCSHWSSSAAMKEPRVLSTETVTGDLPNVAIFIPNFRFGGAERQAYELASRLDRDKYRVTVIALQADGDFAEFFYSVSGLSVTVLGAKNPLSTLYLLNALLREKRVQVIHSFLDATHFYSLLVRLIRRNVKVILNIRDARRDRDFGYETSGSRMRERFLGRFLQSSRFLASYEVSNSEAGRRTNGRKHAAAIEVVPNGIDCERFKPDPSAKGEILNLIKVFGEVFLVGILANCTEYKDYPTFIRAAKIVLQQMENLHFLSFGENRMGTGDLAFRLVRELRITDHFHFLGPTKAVEKLLPGLDVLCSSSVTEAFSNSVCEGMACGVPCVVTDVGDSKTIVGDTGIVVSVDHPEELAAGIIKILRLDQREKARLSTRARQRILEKFEVSRMVSAYERIYSGLTGIR